MRVSEIRVNQIRVNQGLSVVDIKKILVPNLLIYIYLHCVRSSSCCATLLATLMFIPTSTFIKKMRVQQPTEQIDVFN